MLLSVCDLHYVLTVCVCVYMNPTSDSPLCSFMALMGERHSSIIKILLLNCRITLAPTKL